MTANAKAKGSVLYFNVFVFILCGCSRNPIRTEALSEPVLSRQYRQESTTVILSVSETNIAMTGHIQLVLDVQSTPGTDVVFPDVETAVASFVVSGPWSEPKQALPNGKNLTRTEWQLVPDLPGEVVIRPLAITAGTSIVTTEPITVWVRSVLPVGLETLEIKDIVNPALLLPEEQRQHRRWLVLLGLVIIAALLALAIGLRRRTRKAAVIPPHAIALHALENLSDEPVARIHELNRILRAYVETRFALPMIGNTTHEILRTVESHRFMGLTPRLVDFLKSSEEIRFSHRVPDGYEVEAERFVRVFVETTMQEEACG